MRTDSVNLSAQALKDAHDLISVAYGKEYALDKPRFYKNKSKNAQEAHEAIRPTYLDKTPAELKKYLSPDLFKLYELIWKRTVACQMAEALLDQTSVILRRARKGQLTLPHRFGDPFPGFMFAPYDWVDDKTKKRKVPSQTDEGEASSCWRSCRSSTYQSRRQTRIQHPGQDPGRVWHRPPSAYASTPQYLVERKYAVWTRTVLPKMSAWFNEI